MAQFNYQKQTAPCAFCGKMTPTFDVRKIVFCSRIHESEYKFRGRYFGVGSEKNDRPKRDLSKF